MELELGSWKVIQLPRIADDRGSLFSFQSGSEINFDVKRIYFISKVPPENVRGAHAHRQLKQAIIAIGGKIEVKLESAVGNQTIFLNPLQEVLLLEGIVWREMKFSSADTVCLVAASLVYEEADYIRSYEEFKIIIERQRFENPFLRS